MCTNIRPMQQFQRVFVKMLPNVQTEHLSRGKVFTRYFCDSEGHFFRGHAWLESAVDLVYLPHN